MGRKTLVAAGLVTTCNTQFSCGKSQRIIFVDLNWSERNEIAGRSIKARTRKFTFEYINITLISIPSGRIIKWNLHYFNCFSVFCLVAATKGYTLLYILTVRSNHDTSSARSALRAIQDGGPGNFKRAIGPIFGSR